MAQLVVYVAEESGDDPLRACTLEGAAFTIAMTDDNGHILATFKLTPNEEEVSYE